MTDVEKIDLLAWILKKWEIPEDATDTVVIGTMNIACHEAHGYRTYVVAYRCEDKQGEIARLAVRVKKLEDGIRAEVGEIPEHVVVREDGADEDVLASLVVSVGKLKARVKELELLLRQANDLRESAEGCEQRMALRIEEAEATTKGAVCGLQEISAGLHSDPGLRAQEILTMVGASIESGEGQERPTDVRAEIVKAAVEETEAEGKDEHFDVTKEERQLRAGRMSGDLFWARRKRREWIDRMKKKVEGGEGYSQEELSDMESSRAPARKKMGDGGD